MSSRAHQPSMTTLGKTCLMIGLAGLASTLAPTSALAHPHGYLVTLGGGGGGGHGGGGHENMLHITFDWMMAHGMKQSMFGLPGYSDDMLSFEEIIDDPNDPHWFEGMNPLAQGSKIQVVFTRFDVGVSAYDPFNMDEAMDTPGESMTIGNGGDNFNRKIIWNLNPNAPGFDAGAGRWTADFYLRDSSGTHMESEVYTMALRIVPTPGTLGALAMAGMLAGRVGGRRRR